MLTRKAMIIVLAFMLLLNVAFPLAVFGQDTAPTSEAFPTVTSEPVTIEPVPTALPLPTQTPINTSELFGSIFTLLAIITVTFVGGTVTLQAILEFLRRKDVRDQTERLYQSASPETQKLAHDSLLILDEARKTTEDTVDRLFEFLKAITDGQPNAEAVQQLRAELNATKLQVAANTANIAQAAGLDGRP